MTEQEQRVWDAAFGAAFAWHRLTHESGGGSLVQSKMTQSDERCAYFASNIADRAVWAFREKKR